MHIEPVMKPRSQPLGHSPVRRRPRYLLGTVVFAAATLLLPTGPLVAEEGGRGDNKIRARSDRGDDQGRVRSHSTRGRDHRDAHRGNNRRDRSRNVDRWHHRDDRRDHRRDDRRDHRRDDRRDHRRDHYRDDRYRSDSHYYDYGDRRHSNRDYYRHGSRHDSYYRGHGHYHGSRYCSTYHDPYHDPYYRHHGRHASGRAWLGSLFSGGLYISWGGYHDRRFDVPRYVRGHGHAYDSYYYGSVHHGPLGRSVEVYLFPVYYRDRVEYRPYAYCDGRLYGRARFDSWGGLSFDLHFDF